MIMNVSSRNMKGTMPSVATFLRLSFGAPLAMLLPIPIDMM